MLELWRISRAILYHTVAQPTWVGWEFLFFAPTAMNISGSRHNRKRLYISRDQASSPIVKHINQQDYCQPVWLRFHIMYIPLLAMLPFSHWLHLANCQAPPAIHPQCWGNEDRVKFIGCYDHGKALNINWCREQCSCEAQGLWCPDFTACSGIPVNATEICADPYQWSCGCTSVNTRA